MQRHFFHIVNSSPWPLCTSIGAFGITTGSALSFHFYSKGFIVFFLGLLTVVFSAILWWRDVIREGLSEGWHTSAVQFGLRLGVILFIVSEVMFFSGFFWAFFHSSLAPAIELGSVWPPLGIEVFNPWHVPLLNTIILLLSGATITWAHFGIANNIKKTDCEAKTFSIFKEILNSLVSTVLLAVLFTVLQVCEYTEAAFSISDGVYGTTFFMATGFHGFHVIIGTIFILVSTFRFFSYHFSKTHHLGFESASWYWHFVDVVWLFLFISIYWWGNSLLVSGYYISL